MCSSVQLRKRETAAKVFIFEEEKHCQENQLITGLAGDER
jgi:hypothetical protein